MANYTLELTPDAEPLTPGAVGQTYTGQTTIGELRAKVFRVRYSSPGAKPMKLYLNPVESAPRSPGSGMPVGK